MRGIIIAGGSLGNSDRCRAIIKDDDMIICADSGYYHAVEMGVVPYAVLGDFDSADYDAIECNKKIHYPAEKDETDTEIAIRYALEQGCDELVFLGFTGGRVDHELVNVFILADMLKRGIGAYIFDGTSYIYITDSRIELSGKPGDLLSVVPITPKVTGITNGGLQYPLYDFNMEMGFSRGVSNVFEQTCAYVKIKSGMILVITTEVGNL